MLKALKNRLNNRKGFTLIELIVVIAIIAILSAVLIPQMSGFTQRAKDSNTLSEAKNIATTYSVLLVEDPNRTFYAEPTSSNDLVDLQSMAGDFRGTLTEVAVDLTAGVNFTYTSEDEKTQVEVRSGQVQAPTLPSPTSSPIP